ncbi:DUF4190 domain-containing protein [Frigoribacterium sp. ACAM 257]|uniref:DUF4190 domain-containing protein n=1 Tax=Frigoribacterium sp. ACAM 257 TaxID=2508998 RepID=UPI0011B9D064|nr:DUF4190 domain-containing protein [Frigoribacterium sp. ACAM 257]TWX40551.1 DUF4190 domain-containing protein [Frigoribacterium sp. ACAM 257]
MTNTAPSTPPLAAHAAAQSAPAAAGGLHSPLSVTSLVLGIASVALSFTFVVPIVGVVLGVLGRRREPEGRTMALIGIVASAVMLLGSVAFVVVGLLAAVPIGLAGLFHVLG